MDTDALLLNEIKKKLKDNEYKEVKGTGNSPAWENFLKIVDQEENKVGAVKCITCGGLLRYDSVKTGTSHLLKHARHCKATASSSQKSITSFITKGAVPKKAKEPILEKCTKVCAKDMRPFVLFESDPFIELAQALVDIGAQHGHCDAKELLPSGVTVSRHTQKTYTSLRADLLPVIKKAIAVGRAGRLIEINRNRTFF